VLPADEQCGPALFSTCDLDGLSGDSNNGQITWLRGIANIDIDFGGGLGFYQVSKAGKSRRSDGGHALLTLNVLFLHHTK